MKVAGYEVHPAAAVMPAMSDEEFADLKADIAKNGLLCPVEIHRGKLIDGINRARACQAVGATIHTVDVGDLGELTPAEYVVALNLRRRHLTASQRAMLAANLLPAFEAEAGERQKATQRQGAAPVVATLPPPGKRGKSREKAAKTAQVSGRLVQDAKAIKDASPKLAEEVAKGVKTVTEAKRELAPPPTEKAPKNGAPLVSVKERQAVEAACGKIVRTLSAKPFYGRLQPHINAILEAVARG